MVVSDNDVQTQAASVGYLASGADATINGDYDFDALLGQLAQSILVEPIPFNAVRDVGLGLSSQSGESLYQEGGGRHPIGIEIAVDGDGLSLADGLAETGDSLVHAFEAEGIVLWPITFQESLDIRGCLETPVIEQLNDERGEARKVSCMVGG
jgi:hypothetical protein